MKTKTCTKCKETKPASSFYKNKAKPDGLHWICKECVKTYKKSDKIKRVDTNRRLVREFGITLDDWEKMFNQQGGCCFLCGRHQTEMETSIHTDHDHKTGKIRGLLCVRCNSMVGVIDDFDIDTDKIRDYLGGGNESFV